MKDNKKKERVFFPYFLKNDEEISFNFNRYSLQTDGMIFFSTIFIIPFIVSLIFKFVFNMQATGDNTAYQLNILIELICDCVGWTILVSRNRSDKQRTIFYLFIILPIIIQLMFMFAMIPLNERIKDQELIDGLTTIFDMLSQMLAEIAIMILYFADKLNRKRFIKPLKTELKYLIPTIIVGLIALILISWIFFSYFVEGMLFKAGGSDNQDSLEQILNTNNAILKLIGIIILFSFTSLIAPLCEEICMRQELFHLTGNRYVGVIFSALYFGFIHYGASGDFIHFFTYTSAGFVLAYVFNLSNGKIIYTWPIHLIFNTIQVSILLWG